MKRPNFFPTWLIYSNSQASEVWKCAPAEGRGTFHEEGLKLVQNPLSRGLQYRTLYEDNIWQEPDSRDFICQCQTWGQQVRFVPELPFKMQLFDNQVTLLSLQDPLAGAPSFTALSISHPGLAQMLQIAFESLWQKGTPDPREQ